MPSSPRVDALARALAAPAGRGAVLAVGGALALAAAWCAAFVDGYFLGDDFAQLASSGHWDAESRIAEEIALRFRAGFDGVNGFWRPLTFVSFVVSYLLHGGAATGWIAFNLVLHVANAFLAGRLATMLAGDGSRAALAGALVAGSLFFVLSPVWEVALWVSCRFDSLALFFALLAGIAFQHGHTGRALVATAAALASKEAGSVAIIFVALLAAARVLERDPAGGRAASTVGRIQAWLRLVAPWIVLGAAYMALRIAIFGSATRVYKEVQVDLLAASHWRDLVASALPFGRALFPGIPGLRGLLAASLVALGLGAWLAWRRGAWARLAAVLLAAAGSLALLLPHVRGFEVSGIGGRLFYQAAAFYAIAVGLAIHEAGLALRTRRLAPGLVALATAVLLPANVLWGWRASLHYADAQASMHAAAIAIRELAARAGPGDYFMVLVPDAYGRTPFGRNAQGGLMLPPVQPEALTARLLVQTDQDIAALDRTIDGGTIDVLRRHSLFDLMEGRAGPGPWKRIAPTGYYCWSAASRAMRALVVEDVPGGVGPRVASAYAAACEPRK